MELDSKQKGKLRVGLAAAFQDYEALRRFLRDELGFDLNDVTGLGAGLETARDKAIDCVISRGRLDDLLAACATDTNPKLKDVATNLQAELAKSRPRFYEELKKDPFSALFLGTEECFIGRAKLRAALKEMESEQGTKRVLVVNAPDKKPARGKTYTFELLRLLDRLGTNNVVVLIDFSQFREGDLGSRYKDIVEKINSRMRVPADEMPKMNESQTRWFQNAIDKFEVVAKESGRKLWLIFDHVGAGEIEDKIADALASTTIYTISEATALRVILIDVDPPRLNLEVRIRNKLRVDDAALPVEDELFEFFKQARTWLNKADPQDQTLKGAARDIMQALAALPAEEQPYGYSSLAWNKAVQLGLVS